MSFMPSHTDEMEHRWTDLLLSTLEEAVGQSFQIVRGSAKATASFHTTNDVRNGMLMELARERGYLPPRHVIDNGSISVACLPGGRFLAVVDRDSQSVATAMLQGYEPEALVRTLGFALQAAHDRLRLTKTESELHSCTEQLSLSLEESVWLRELSLQIEDCASNSSATPMAERIMPTLSAVIDAESLVFIQQRHSRGLPCEESSIACFGGRSLPLSFCTNVIEAWAGDALYDPVVVNAQDSKLQTIEGHTVHSMILVQVQHHADQFGWLLAVNRHTKPLDHVDSEFGTIEASMLQAAGVLLGTHAHNTSLFQQKEEALVGMILTLVRTLEARDPYTQGHSDRVASIARLLSDELGRTDEDSQRIHLTGLLHDIGKIGIPDAVLNKPGRLSEEDFDLIKRHPTIGVRILSGIPSLSHVLPGVQHHHERMDGEGYPSQLCGNAIPLDGRILAVADAFDAMTSSRPYRQGMHFERAASILRDGAGTQWDANVVDAFFRLEPSIRGICGRCRSADAAVQNCLTDSPYDESEVMHVDGPMQPTS